MLRRLGGLALLSLVLPARLAAQHEGHAMPAAAGLAVPVSREASGTAWLPDETPMYAFHRTAGMWSVMLHGSAALHYLNEGSDRGDDQLGSTNWIMVMARRPLTGGRLSLHAMASLDPVTVGECGYPDLLATGEFCDGEPIHDRQHPHDMFMELTAGYERPLSDGIGIQLYGGPAGEPALGPVAFPHRISALPNPFAPVSHHWLDSTHIAFGVVTAGVYGRTWKIEGSAFNGREPDEDRYDFDLAALDSYAARIWILPSPRWALQLSAGRLEEAESPHEEASAPELPPPARVDVTRTTASATYHRPLARNGHWASTLAWGRNEEQGRATQAALAETNVNLRQRDVFFARAEIVEKTAEDLVLENDDIALEEPGDGAFTVGKLSAGYMRLFSPGGRLSVGVGGMVSVGLLGAALEPAYGTRRPVGGAVFLRVRPALAAAPGHADESR